MYMVQIDSQHQTSISIRYFKWLMALRRQVECFPNTGRYRAASNAGPSSGQISGYIFLMTFPQNPPLMNGYYNLIRLIFCNVLWWSPRYFIDMNMSHFGDIWLCWRAMNLLLIFTKRKEKKVKAINGQNQQQHSTKSPTLNL